MGFDIDALYEAQTDQAHDEFYHVDEQFEEEGECNGNGQNK